MSLYPLLRRALFRIEPEVAHGLSVQALRLAGRLGPLRELAARGVFAAPSSPVEVAGLRFANRVGLAAGYDKDALAWRGLTMLGFGHLEVGTVTPRAQAGNPRPRVFRVPGDAAVINRLGFPGDGAEAVARRLVGARAWLSARGVVLGVNLGKQGDTPLERAHEDYVALARRFAPLCDYLAINVSSPNTLGLRSLQARAMLEGVLGPLVAARDEAVARLGRPVPLFVKLSPDLDAPALDDAVAVAIDCGVDGLIATNTTVSRDGVQGPHAAEQGGLSGRPLAARSLAVLHHLVGAAGTRLPIISVGGIDSPAEARARLEAGASLVQLYTGLIYEGPGLVARIARAC